KFPRPDVPSKLRKVPARPSSSPSSLSTPSPSPLASPSPLPSPSQSPPPSQSPATTSTPAPEAILQPTTADQATPTEPTKPHISSPKPSRIEPLSAAPDKLQLTVSQEMRDMIERAKELTSHSNPTGDLEVILEKALRVYVEKLETDKRGKSI